MLIISSSSDKHMKAAPLLLPGIAGELQSSLWMDWDVDYAALLLTSTAVPPPSLLPLCLSRDASFQLPRLIQTIPSSWYFLCQLVSHTSHDDQGKSFKHQPPFCVLFLLCVLHISLTRLDSWSYPRHYLGFGKYQLLLPHARTLPLAWLRIATGARVASRNHPSNTAF